MIFPTVKFKKILDKMAIFEYLLAQKIGEAA
jgi:hypothetical protein